jgi:Na+-driven multidrug efflux pump
LYLAYSCIKHSSWRTIFWIAFAIDVVVLVVVFLFYHPMNQYIHEEGKSSWYQVKHLDWVGLFLFSAGITVFLMGISFGGNNYPW